MRIAVSVWDKMISPVFDSAETLEIYEISDGAVKATHHVSIAGSDVDKAVIVAENAEILVCGALSNEMMEQLTIRGVRLHPWTMGESENIILNYLRGAIGECEYSMPGCRRGRMGRCGSRGQGKSCGGFHTKRGGQ